MLEFCRCGILTAMAWTTVIVIFITLPLDLAPGSEGKDYLVN